MSLVGYAEEFFRPVTKVKINGVGKIVKPSEPRLLSRICSRVETFFSAWTQHSYDAWVKNSLNPSRARFPERRDAFTTSSGIPVEPIAHPAPAGLEPGEP